MFQVIFHNCLGTTKIRNILALELFRLVRLSWNPHAGLVSLGLLCDARPRIYFYPLSDVSLTIVVGLNSRAFRAILPHQSINIGFQANLTGLKNIQTFSQKTPNFSSSQTFLVLVGHNLITKIYRFMFPQVEMLSSLSAVMTVTRRMARRIDTLFHDGQRERFPRSSAKRT